MKSSLFIERVENMPSKMKTTSPKETSVTQTSRVTESTYRKIQTHEPQVQCSDLQVGSSQSKRW